MCTLSQKVCTLCLSGSLIHVELSQVKLICIDLTPLTTQRASLDGQEKLTRNRKGRSHFPGIASTEGTACREERGNDSHTFRASLSVPSSSNQTKLDTFKDKKMINHFLVRTRLLICAIVCALLQYRPFYNVIQAHCVVKYDQHQQHVLLMVIGSLRKTS